MCDFPRAAGEGEGVARRPLLRLSGSYAFTSTTILFSGDRRADLLRHAAFVGAEIPLSRATTSSLSLQLGAGGILGGHLEHASRAGIVKDEMGPGLAAFAGLAYRLLDEHGAAPFVQLTGALSVTHAITRTPTGETPRYTALDLRVGAIAGKTVGGVFTPYLTARAFGGPIAWTFDGADVTGTDLYKYQLGGGASLALLGRKLDFFVEGIALGERGVAAGLGTTFL